MTPPQDVPLSGVGQFHRSINPRGVEQPIASSGTRRIRRRQRFHQQTCNSVEDFLLPDVRIPGNSLRAFEREAGRKYGQSPQHRPLDVRQQIVAPLERRAQGLVARGRGPAARPAQGKLAVEKFCDLPKAIGADAPRGQFDRKRNAAEPATDVSDNRRVRIAQLDRRAIARRTFHEKLRRREIKHLGSSKVGIVRGALKRRQVMNALALDAEYLPARHQDMQVRQIAKKPFRHHSRLRNHMFGAVQDKQDALATQVGNKSRNGVLGLDRQTERGSHCTRQELGIAERTELHKADGAAEFHQQSMRDGECHRRFAH
ncbi:MAG TPA: hypothetical protein VNN81_08205, partial [Bradyrhizobium sp.]|nr:hypothetical protein [Bradyrhizobium sp.]